MRRPALRRDPRATIDVPYKLLISLVLMAMAAAILLPALSAYQRSEVGRRTEVAVEAIASAVRSVHIHPGSSRTVRLDVPAAGGFRLERLTIGGDLMGRPGEACTITWTIDGDGRGVRVVESRGSTVPMAGIDGMALVLDGASCVIVLQSRVAPEGSWCERYVLVEAV